MNANKFSRMTKSILALTAAFLTASFVFAQEANDNLISNPANFDNLDVPELEQVVIPEAGSANAEKADGGSFNCGVQFGAGMTVSMVMKPYISQDVSFRMNFNDAVGMDIGVNVLENVIYRTAKAEPYLCVSPFLDLYVYNWYIGGGCMLFNQKDTGITPTFLARVGYDWGNWKVGNNGTLCLRTGISASVTPYLLDVEEGGDSTDALGAGIGSLLLTVFNIPKFDIGVTYYLHN